MQLFLSSGLAWPQAFLFLIPQILYQTKHMSFYAAIYVPNCWFIYSQGQCRSRTHHMSATITQFLFTVRGGGGEDRSCVPVVFLQSWAIFPSREHTLLIVPSIIIVVRGDQLTSFSALQNSKLPTCESQQALAVVQDVLHHTERFACIIHHFSISHIYSCKVFSQRVTWSEVH